MIKDASARAVERALVQFLVGQQHPPPPLLSPRQGQAANVAPEDVGQRMEEAEDDPMEEEEIESRALFLRGLREQAPRGGFMK